MIGFEPKLLTQSTISYSQDEVESILGQYFRTSRFHSFVRQLYVYGWRKQLRDGSYYHPLFHRDMELDETTLSQFVRGGGATSSVQSDESSVTSSASASERASLKRAAFKNACGVIKSVANRSKHEESAVSPPVKPQLPNSKRPNPDDVEPEKRGRGRPKKRRFISPDVEKSARMTSNNRVQLKAELAPYQPIKRREFYLNIKSRPPLNVDALEKAAEDMLSLEYAYQSTYTAVTPTTPGANAPRDGA